MKIFQVYFYDERVLIFPEKSINLRRNFCYQKSKTWSKNTLKPSKVSERNFKNYAKCQNLRKKIGFRTCFTGVF